MHSVQLVIEKCVIPFALQYFFFYKWKSVCEEGGEGGYAGGLMVEGGVTRVGLLQLVPAKEGSFLLLAEV